MLFWKSYRKHPFLESYLRRFSSKKLSYKLRGIHAIQDTVTPNLPKKISDEKFQDNNWTADLNITD